ncbi:MAG TPA: hypothetical protein PLK99_08225 [Burkholderiales bacterium]|nr:hypothetical protein [Burkholderiales bacterium]
MFTDINVPTGAPQVTPAISANLTVGPSLGQPMAIILTNNVTLSSLSKPQVTGLMSGYNADWSYVDSSLPSAQVIVCRRVPGSGTQASINDFFFGFPCSTSQQVPATSSVGSGSAGAWLAPIVIENSGSGQLAACMTAAEDGTAPGYTISITDGTLSTAAQDSTHITLPAGGMAIGLMGLDRPAQTIKTAAINGASAGITETYKFAAIDGVAATIENAVIGNYDVVVNNSWNARSVTVNGIAPMSGDQATFYAAMKSNSGNSAILGACKTPPVPGVAALADPVNLNYDPTTTSCTVNGVGYTNILLNPVMRTVKANSCQPAQQEQ